MRGNTRFCGFTVLLLLVMTSSNIVADDESDNWYAEGGNSVLMEQFTATWCDVCAQIDPWISNFADERGSRLVRIALHDPVADPLGSSISSERLSIHSNSMDLAPSFWFDSNNEIKGTVDPVDLDRALLNSEGVRESDTIISISGAENFDSNSIEYTGGDRGWAGDVPKTSLNVERLFETNFEPTMQSEGAIRYTVKELIKEIGL